MMIVSSQHYINDEIVESKKEQLIASGATYVVIPCWEIGEVNGEPMVIQMDGHHTLAAARELGLEIRYDLGEADDDLTGEDALKAHWMDGNYYNVETSDPAVEYFDLVF